MTSIRQPAAIDDFLRVAEVRAQNKEERGGDREGALEEIAQHHWDGKDLYLATEKGEDVGYAVGLKNYSSYHLIDVYVKPEWRRQGIGTALIQEQAKNAKEQGCTEIYGYATRLGTPAYKLQRRAGLTMRWKRGGHYGHALL